jgi:hypothetical protein
MPAKHAMNFHRLLACAVWLFVASNSAHAFYDPLVGRWLNRDPLSTARLSPEATGVMENVLLPFEYFNGGNLFHFVHNNPIGQVDPHGLDVWIVRDKCSTFGHVWVIGENGDGTYWDSDKMPGEGPFAPANCPAKINFNPQSGFDPKNLGNPCFEITRHVVTSPAVDKKTRDEAEHRADEDKGRYDALCNNCIDYANAIADYALGAKLKELIENRKRRKVN